MNRNECEVRAVWLRDRDEIRIAIVEAKESRVVVYEKRWPLCWRDAPADVLWKLTREHLEAYMSAHDGAHKGKR